jgi:hypothetical protein
MYLMDFALPYQDTLMYLMDFALLEVFLFYFIYALLEVNLETDKTIRSPNEKQPYLLTF